ncbi:MAG: hypothetical protein Kow0065_10760 [Methylomicrobium sp.]
MAPGTQHVPIDAASVKHMLFELRLDLSQTPNDGSAKRDMAEKIAANLTEWGYAISTQPDKQVSHQMRATVDSVRHGNTPTGFSFTAGNSDPRAVNFQKASIVPVTCSLISASNSAESADYTMEFIATPFSASEQRSRLIDQVSTVCLNLLKSSGIKPEVAPSRPQTESPSWAPDVLIETVEEPETQTPSGVSEPSTAESISVKKKGYKQITIHNQGTPVILKLGHERK